MPAASLFSLRTRSLARTHTLIMHACIRNDALAGTRGRVGSPTAEVSATENSCDPRRSRDFISAGEPLLYSGRRRLENIVPLLYREKKRDTLAHSREREREDAFFGRWGIASV